MKKLVFIILIALSFVSVPAQIDNAALQEAVKISTQVVNLFNEKKFEEALPLAQRVISIREKELGKNHPLLAQAWRNLAYVQYQLKGFKFAEDSFKKAFEIYEKNSTLTAADEKHYAELLETVAVYEVSDGDILGAEKKLRRSIELNEKLRGKDALETANALLKLAQVYQLKSDYESAAPLLLRVLEIKNAKLGIANSQTREAYDTAFCTLNKLERKAEIEQMRDKYKPDVIPIIGQSNENTSATPVKSIAGGVINGKSTYLAKPAYPLEARNKRVRGTVNVQVTINEKGEVIFACAVSGAKELQRSSETAAYQSKFSPVLLSGKPVKVTGIIVYNYVP